MIKILLNQISGCYSVTIIKTDVNLAFYFLKLCMSFDSLEIKGSCSGLKLMYTMVEATVGSLIQPIAQVTICCNNALLLSSSPCSRYRFGNP